MMADLALDFGTSCTRIVDDTGRLLVDEPTVAAVDDDTGRLLAFGSQALETGARAAGRVHVVRPVRRGQLVDLHLAEEVLAEMLRRSGATRLSHPRVLVCVHVGATPVQHRAFDRALRKAGARQVRFVEQPVAGALGASLAIEEPAGSMVVEVGAGTTDIGLLALGGIVTSSLVACGGDDLDAGVRRALVHRHNLVVDRATAEELRRAIGTVSSEVPDVAAEVLGRDAGSGRPAVAVVTRSELRPVLVDILGPVLRAVVSCISDAPPDLANDLLGRGIVLTGGTSALEGLDRCLARATGLPVHVVPDPRLTAVRGAMRCSSSFDLLVQKEPTRRH